jgi:hypothetical protein
MSKHLRPRLAAALAAAALALPLLAFSADAQTRYGAGPGDFYRGEPGNRSDYDPRWRREPGIVLYSRSGFGGRNIALDGDMPDLRQIGFNDRASSLRVNWGVWEVCRDVNFGGRCARVDRSVSDFGRFDDQISSVRLLDGRRYRR